MCRSSWAIAAAGIVEFIDTTERKKINSGAKAVPLSAQYLMSCTSGHPRLGCVGGDPLDALLHLQRYHLELPPEWVLQRVSSRATRVSLFKTIKKIQGRAKLIMQAYYIDLRAKVRANYIYFSICCQLQLGPNRQTVFKTKLFSIFSLSPNV